MENRFVYFADAHETLNQQQAAKAEGGVDFKKLAADLAQMEKEKPDVKLEKGGRNAVSQAELLGGNEHVTETGKDVLKNKRQRVQAARDTLDKNDTPEGRNKLNSAVKALKKSVEFQKKQIKKQAYLKKEFENLAKLPNAKELVKDLKVSIDSKSHSNTLDGLLPKEEFDNLSVKQKEKYLDFVKDILLNGETEVGKSGIEALRDKLLADKDVPKTWRDWLKNPGSWDGPKDCQTLEYAVKWISKNLGETKHQVAKYENFMSDNSHEFNKAGVGLLNVDAFRDKSRGERKTYINEMESKARSLNLANADKLQEMQVSEGAETKVIKTEMKTSGEKKEKAESDKFGELAKKIQDSPIRRNLMEKLDTKKKEAGKDKSSDIQNRAAAARGGEAQPSLFNRMLSKFGGGKKEEEGREDDTETHKQAGKAVVDDLIGTESTTTDREENLKLSDSQRKQIAEMFGFKELPKGREWENSLAILMLKDVDAKSVEDATKKNRGWWKGKTELFS